MKNVILCDLDGTIANITHRLPCIFPPEGQRKDWEAFHAGCVNDTPYTDVIEVVEALMDGTRKLYFLSGRNDTVREQTVKWIDTHVWAKYTLCMRKAEDRRPDHIIKLEMVQQLGLTPEDVLCIFDDRQSVVDMWRANGFRVLQVAAWKE